MKSKICRLIKYDLVCGFRYNYKKCIVTVIFALIVCLFFYSLVDDALEACGGDASVMDFFINAFKGTKLVEGSDNAFLLPIVFLGIQILVASLVGYYPFDDMYGYGKQVFIRVDKKVNWWFSKCIWTAVSVIVFYVIFYGSILIFCLLTGQEIGISYNEGIVSYLEQSYIGLVSRKDMCIYIFVMPFLYSMMVSLAQVALSMVLSPMLSFLVTMIYHIAGVFVINKVFLISYAMVMRDKTISTGGVSPTDGIVPMIIGIIIAVVAGVIIINRKEIFER